MREEETCRETRVRSSARAIVDIRSTLVTSDTGVNSMPLMALSAKGVSAGELDGIVISDGEQRGALSLFPKPACEETTNGTSSRALFELVLAAFGIDMVALVAR